MDISKVKYNLGHKVRLVLPRHYVDGEYLLTGCIIRKNDEGRFFYQAELSEIGTRAVIIAGLESIFEIGSLAVEGLRKENENV